MTRLAAMLALGLLAATPASARCVPAAEAPDNVRVIVGPAAAVGAMPAWIVPALGQWLATTPGMPSSPTGYVAAVVPTGILLFPLTADGLCDGTAGRVSVEETNGFLRFLRDWMDARGLTKERVA